MKKTKRLGIVAAIAIIAVITAVTLYDKGHRQSIQTAAQVQVLSKEISTWTWVQKVSEQVEESVSKAARQEAVQQLASNTETLEPEDDAESVEMKMLPEYDFIRDKAQFEELFGEEGNYNFAYANAAYTVDFIRDILRHLVENDNSYEYRQYKDPVKAAEKLLRLGAGKGEITGSYFFPRRNKNAEDLLKWDEAAVRLLESMSLVVPEGATVTVTYTFEQDGSSVQIPMELVEASQGIWAPAGSGLVREVYGTDVVFLPDVLYEYNAESSDVDYYIQSSQYGFYKLDKSGITCLYPYFLAPDTLFDTVGNLIYFVTDSDYNEGETDYQADVVAILDIDTGVLDKETIIIPEEIRDINVKEIVIGTGWGLILWGDISRAFPLVNTGASGLGDGPVWNGKAVASLNEQERNAYGADVRKQLLEEPGLLLKLSNRTLTETYAYVDLDGDGTAEKISLSGGRKSWFRFGDYVLQVGDSKIEGSAVEGINNIWAFSLDGNEILIAIYDNGPSFDPSTTFYAYRDGKLLQVGQFDADIRFATIENGFIYADFRVDVIQTDHVRGKWQMGKQGVLEWVEQDIYDFTTLNDVVLLSELTIYSKPNTNSKSHKIQHQTVRFVKTDSNFEWVYLETESGDSGWFKVGKGKEEDYWHMFYKLLFYD